MKRDAFDTWSLAELDAVEAALEVVTGESGQSG